MKIIGVLVGVLALGACGKGDKGSGSTGGGGGDPSAITSEGRIQLDRLAKRAKMYFVENAAYPAGTEAPTPAKPCCSEPGKTCKAIAADWNATEPGHPWSQLIFDITDDGGHFQYAYTGTAESFTATATADPACDGHPITITARGTVNSGNPVVEISDGGR